MSSQQFQLAHENLCDLTTRLLTFLEEIKVKQISGDDTNTVLQSVEKNIIKSLKALNEQKYQVAVIAAMKAGKSTFLNVLIGEDILASESEACTVCRTDIRPIHNTSLPKLIEYREENEIPFLISEGNAENIRREFLKRTHEIRTTKNVDKTIRFELHHPIEAISKIPSLSGFTLVDTPGPNEWESASFSTIELKKTALEALRTCDVILFILDYSSFKDNTNSELLKELIEQRKESLYRNKGKLYFILNKVDRKTEKDRQIENVIEDLRETLINFGIPSPIIYPASAWQGLLSKLIQRGIATKEHKADFKKFFLSRYIQEDEDGELYVPKIADAAIQALAESNIPKIEQSVIQTVVQNSGWDLLNDALNHLDKAAKAIEDTVNTRLSGWEIELESLKQNIEEYKKRADIAKEKVESVKESVEQQKKILIDGFSQGICRFADTAKEKIEDEILSISQSSIFSRPKENKPTVNSSPISTKYIPQREINLSLKIPDWIPFVGGLSFTFETKTPLVEALKNAIPNPFDVSESDEYEITDPYRIRVKTKEEGEKIIKTINDFCSPHLQNWWVVTQDKLINDGTKIREELVQKIQKDIQVISDELSAYLGESLQVELNLNRIEFPSFDFPGIDAQIKDQQDYYKKKVKNIKYTGKIQGFCETNEEYEARKEEYVFENAQRLLYEIDLLQTCHQIKTKIDNQAAGTQSILQRVIEQQIENDFKNAEKQINDYIERFQNLFENLLIERQSKEGERERICSVLEETKSNLTNYLNELYSLRLTLDSWQPN